jgi:hypothetical protein
VDRRSGDHTLPRNGAAEWFGRQQLEEEESHEQIANRPKSRAGQLDEKVVENADLSSGSRGNCLN